MKRGKKSIMIFFILVFFLVSIYFSFQNNQFSSISPFQLNTFEVFKPKNQDLIHSSIVISSDADFTSENGVVIGTRTQIDPFIISNWTITPAGSEDEIAISSTTVFFIIQNCTIINFTVQNGISLTNVINGKIYNNSFENNEVSLNIFQSTNLFIENNHFSNSFYKCMDLYDVSESQIVNNSFYYSDNAIYSSRLDDCIIKENLCLYSTQGILGYYSSNCSIIQNEFLFNSGDGMNLFYFTNCSISNNNCSYNDAIGLSIFNCSSNLFFQNNCSFNNQSGIAMFSSDGNYLSKNNITYNNYQGIVFFDGSKNNTVIENFLYGNGYDPIGDTNIYNNLIDNECYDSDGNPIYGVDHMAILPDPTTTESTSPDSETSSEIPQRSLFSILLPYSWILLVVVGILIMIQFIHRSGKKSQKEQEEPIFDPTGTLKTKPEVIPKLQNKDKIEGKLKKTSSKNQNDTEDDIHFDSYM